MNTVIPAKTENMALRKASIDISKPELSLKFMLVLVILVVVISLVVALGKTLLGKVQEVIKSKIPKKDTAAESFEEELGL